MSFTLLHGPQQGRIGFSLIIPNASTQGLPTSSNSPHQPSDDRRCHRPGPYENELESDYVWLWQHFAGLQRRKQVIKRRQMSFLEFAALQTPHRLPMNKAGEGLEAMALCDLLC
jgi:hypothetical protein